MRVVSMCPCLIDASAANRSLNSVVPAVSAVYRLLCKQLCQLIIDRTQIEFEFNFIELNGALRSFLK